MKRIYFFMLAILMAGTLSMNAQVLIGDKTDPHEGAVLELKSSSKGLLLPKISLNDVSVFQLDANVSDTPATAVGMMVFNTNESVIGGDGKGVYIWNGEIWTLISDDSLVKQIIIFGHDVAKYGELVTFSAYIRPANVANKRVVWSIIKSDDMDMRDESTIDPLTGVLTIGESTTTGTITVVATATDGSGVFGEHEVTIKGFPKCGAWVDTRHTTWLEFMCHNLGADQDYDPLIYSDDILGDLYQWGRVADGHQKRTSRTVSGPATTADLDANGQVKFGNNKYGKFIVLSDEPYDWRTPQSNTLWGSGGSDTVNPCPSGWAVPTSAQLEAVLANNTVSYSEDGTMIGTSLFLPKSGIREYDGFLETIRRVEAAYWTSTTDGSQSYCLELTSIGSTMATHGRAVGASVRCVKGSIIIKN